MNYFILPKMETDFLICINNSEELIKPYLLNSLIYFTDLINKQLDILNCEIKEEIKEEIKKEIKKEIKNKYYKSIILNNKNTNDCDNLIKTNTFFYKNNLENELSEKEIDNLCEKLIKNENENENENENKNENKNEDNETKKENHKNNLIKLLNNFDIYKIFNTYEYLCYDIPNYYSKYLKKYNIDKKEYNSDNNLLCKYKVIDIDIFILHEIIELFKINNDFYDYLLFSKKECDKKECDKKECYSNFGFYNINKKNIYKYFETDNNIYLNNIQNLKNIQENKSNFLYYKINNNEKYNSYILKLLKLLNNILNNQKIKGCCLFNINNMIYKPNIELLFILNNIYEKVVVIKPLSLNIFSNDIYIFCKNFKVNDNEKLISIIQQINNLIFVKKNNIQSIINIDLPIYFLNKIEEINIIIGQQKLENIYQNINIIKSSKNKIEKLEIIKKNNIIKCIKWFSKNNIPYNKNYDLLNHIS